MALINDFQTVFSQWRGQERGQQIASVRQGLQGNILVPISLLMLIGMMTLPLPPLLLDTFFSFNIAFSLIVLLAAVYVMRPLEFAVFPTILLVATLFRLALNVASTRVVLLEGHAGGDSAGKVIQAFGEVVIGGNYAVGLVVFLILMIINFVVVTKGAGRISEVSARFTLDAMPGKQMAIDADLNAGVIDQEEAKQRREEVSSEADFYGAMDGASKFVRGDAIAGILILVINLLGGMFIGMLQHDLSFSDAASRYALLTIGDGLVAQIPSLLLSTGAAIMVTRVSKSEQMPTQIRSQLFSSHKPLLISAGILITMGLVPGMPHLAFLSLGFVCLVMGLSTYVKTVKEKEQQKQDEQLKEQHQPAQTETKELDWDDVQPVDMVGLEVGYRLVPLVDQNQNGQLLARIKSIRKKLSRDLGFLLPSIHIRDNLDLPPNAYRISLMGVSIVDIEIHPERELAINPGQVYGEVIGIPGKDPAFGLDAVWIESSQRDQAQAMGYTVVDPSTVVATHLNQILLDHAHELLGHEEVQKLLDRLGESTPKLVENLVPQPLSLSVVLKVLQALLKESVVIRDIRTICEAMAEIAHLSQDPDILLSHVREALGRQILHHLVPDGGSIPVITLSAELEHLLSQAVMQAKQQGGAASDAVIEPGLAEKLRSNLNELVQSQEAQGKPPLLLVSTGIRAMMARFARQVAASFHVISFNEVPENREITIEATTG